MALSAQKELQLSRRQRRDRGRRPGPLTGSLRGRRVMFLKNTGYVPHLGNITLLGRPISDYVFSNGVMFLIGEHNTISLIGNNITPPGVIKGVMFPRNIFHNPEMEGLCSWPHNPIKYPRWCYVPEGSVTMPFWSYVPPHPTGAVLCSWRVL